MNLRINLTRNCAFLVLVCLIWSNDILLQFFRAIMLRIPIIGEFPDFIIGVIYLALAFISKKIYRLSKLDIIFISTWIVVIAANGLVYKDFNEYLYMCLYDFSFKFMPLYVIGRNIPRLDENEKNILMEILYILSILTITSSILYNNFVSAPMSDTMSK